MPVRHSAIPVRANPSHSALQNPFLGIALTKAQRHAKSVQKKTLYRTKYLRCKQSKTNKGHAIYPEAGAKKCKSQYKKWQKHRGKAGTRALKLSDRLEKKGKLDPELEAALLQDIEDSEMEVQIDPDLTDEELAMLDDEYLSDEDSTTLEGGDNTMLYVGLGGLAVAGLLGFLLLKG